MWIFVHFQGSSSCHYQGTPITVLQLYNAPPCRRSKLCGSRYRWKTAVYPTHLCSKWQVQALLSNEVRACHLLQQHKSYSLRLVRNEWVRAENGVFLFFPSRARAWGRMGLEPCLTTLSSLSIVLAIWNTSLLLGHSNKFSFWTWSDFCRTVFYI